MAMIDGTIGKADRKVELVHGELRELRRQACALPKRRGGAGSRDARKYALGSTLAVLGLADIDDIALLGLLAHPLQMLRWASSILSSTPDLGFGALIQTVLSDSHRRAWCEQWGRALWWRYRKALYDAEVTSFLNSGRTGRGERWRRDQPTAVQLGLILDLCGVLHETGPKVGTKGEAFDWIYARGGNPTFWEEPALLSFREEDDV